MFERFIERLAKSKYCKHFVLKGGLLISSIIGVNERTTLDMDATIVGFEVHESIIEEIICEIIEIEVNDTIQFEYCGITPIRKNDKYNNYSIAILAIYEKMRISMKIDITTGDVITPKQINYFYSLMFEKRKVMIQAYPLETILAEKIETILSRNIATTRARDFYDVYMLYKLKAQEISWITLRTALFETARVRNSLSEIEDAKEIVEEIRHFDNIRLVWKRYQENNRYTKAVLLDNCLDILQLILDKLGI